MGGKRMYLWRAVDDEGEVLDVLVQRRRGRHQYPPAVIQHSVWLYLRFTLSYRDAEELLAERGLDVSYETIRHLPVRRRERKLQRFKLRNAVLSWEL